MIASWFQALEKKFLDFVGSPKRVFGWCVGLVCASVLLNGSLVNLYRLKTDKIKLEKDISESQIEIQRIERSLRSVRDPDYLEKQALDKFDLADENDLVFVFSDE
jgi:hypothetical protein